MNYIISGNLCVPSTLTMEKCNNVTVFILLGLSKNKNTEILCFVLFLFCYIAVWIGDVLTMISVTCSQLDSDTQADNWLTGRKKAVSYRNRMAQLFTVHFFGGAEILTLTGTAYDRCVAICKPLHCAVAVSRQRRKAFVVACCTGALHPLPVGSFSPSPYPSVAPLRQVTTSVTCILCWNWPARIHAW